MAVAYRSQTPEFRRAYYAANVERLKARKKANRLKNLERFRLQEREQSKRYYERHKEERQAVNRERGRKNHPLKRRGWKLKQKYGISLAQYDEMYAAQGGVCGICGKPQIRDLHVDHCHVTEKIRGLLCGTCNLALNNVVDLEWLDKCRAYLTVGI